MKKEKQQTTWPGWQNSKIKLKAHLRCAKNILMIAETFGKS